MYDFFSKKLKFSVILICSIIDILLESIYVINFSLNIFLDTMLIVLSFLVICIFFVIFGFVFQVNDEVIFCFIFNDLVSYILSQFVKCERCEKYLKKYNCFKKKYGKLENKLKELQIVQVCFFFQLVCQCDENDFMNRCVIKRIQLNIFFFFLKNQELEIEEEMVGEEFVVEMEEEFGEEFGEEFREEFKEDFGEDV